MDGAVNIAVRGNLVTLAVEGELQEVHQIAFEFFFRVDDGNLLVIVTQLGLEAVKDKPVHGDLPICLIQGLGDG